MKICICDDDKTIHARLSALVRVNIGNMPSDITCVFTLSVLMSNE